MPTLPRRKLKVRTKEGSISELLEKLSELEHKQWMYYSKNVAKQIKQADNLEQLINHIRRKWGVNWKDYSLLSEEDKDKDREWATKVMRIIRKNKRSIKEVLREK